MGRNTLSEEIFVDIPGYPNYQVSNFGRVANVRRGTDLTPRPDTQGYMNVALHHNGHRRDVGVHRLVAQAFFTDYSPDTEVKHINGDKRENTVRNLTLGRKLRVKIRIVDLDQEFDSIHAAAAYLSVPYVDVHKALNRRGGTVRGHSFEVVDRDRG